MVFVVFAASTTAKPKRGEEEGKKKREGEEIVDVTMRMITMIFTEKMVIINPLEIIEVFAKEEKKETMVKEFIFFFFFLI